MKTKRTLSLALSIMMIVSSLLLPANAFANDYVTGYDEVKNPLIQDACDENYVQAKTVFSSGAASYSSDVVYSNPIQAAEALRDGLVKRQNPIKIEFHYTKDFDDSSTTGVAIYNKLFNMAISEDISVSSVDGDYLRWSWGGYGVNHAYKDIGGGRMYSSLVYNVSYYTTADEESILTDKINTDIGALNLDGKSEYLKVKAIHDYLCESIKYDYVNLNNKEYKYKFSGYGSLVLGYGVCQGYSALFTRICEENGLISRIIVGQNHAWNIVKVGDKFYNVDVTWDDTHYDTPGDPNGNYWSDNYYHKWMLKGSEDFDQHTTVDEFSTEEFWASYPLAKTAYVCNHENSYIVIPDTADCTKGFKSHKYCENCGLEFEQKIIPANSKHIITTSVVAPTCTEQGYTNQKCSRCKYENKVNYVKPKMHSNVAKVTKATISKDGKIEYTCTVCKRKYSTVIPKASNIKLSATSYTYDGKVKTPSVTVKDSKGKVLRKNTDYTVSYASGRKYVGKYAVKITFKGNYYGTKTLYFTIVPKTTSISSLSAGSKKFTVKWKKQATQTTGYQIQYSTSSKFTNAKTVTVSKNSTTSKIITKLSGKKKYYVRVRTYKKVGSTYYYSSWSKAKYVTTKK